MNGYGRYLEAKRFRYAHRKALELALGRPLGDGLLACHHCDNPPCCNPSHLFEATHTDNLRDMAAKGRDRNGSRRLSDDDIRAIRRARANGQRLKAIASQFGTDESTVSKIARRVRFARLPDVAA